MAQDASYKHQDHALRGVDEYANAKYDITTAWLGLGQRAAVEGRTLANVGCGSGEYNLLAAASGLEVIACEPEAGAFQMALAAAAGVERVRVLQVGLMELAAAQPPVDYLVMHDVLEHIEDERAAVAAMRALVRPGGQAVLSVPAGPWLFGHHDVQLGHYRRYTRPRLVGLFADGWEVLRSRYYGPAFIPVTFVYSRWLRRAYAVKGVTSTPFLRALFRAACQVQRAMPLPFGTSALVHLRRR